MVFRVNKGGISRHQQMVKGGTVGNYGGEGGGDHKNIKILKKPQGGSGKF